MRAEQARAWLRASAIGVSLYIFLRDLFERRSR